MKSKYQILNSTGQVMKLLTSFATVIVLSSCNNNSKKITFQENNFTVEAHVLKDSVTIRRGDTLLILNGQYYLNDTAKSIYQKLEFRSGILVDDYEISDGNSKYEGSFINQPLDDFLEADSLGIQDIYYTFLSKYVPQLLQSNLFWVPRKFNSIEMGVPDGTHTVKDGNSVICSAEFKKGVPTGKWITYQENSYSELIFDKAGTFQENIFVDDYIKTVTKYISWKRVSREEFSREGYVVERESYIDDLWTKENFTYDDEGKMISKRIGNKEFIYENGKEIGAVVKVTFHIRYEGIELAVPSGKMWTPLYYTIENCNGYYLPPSIYPRKANWGGWLIAYKYKFPEEDDFVSYSVSRRNNKAITGYKDQAVLTSNYGCNNMFYHLYFLEENL